MTERLFKVKISIQTSQEKSKIFFIQSHKELIIN
jgi:hypothetical protein